MTQQQSADYIIAYGYNDKFYLTEEEAAAIVRATEQGKRIVKFSKRVFTTSYSWIMPIEEVKSEQNPILEDPDYQNLQKARGQSGDGAFRQRMALEKRLDQKYPYEKYAKDWDEINNPTQELSI